jgi:hypothetical protein
MGRHRRVAAPPALTETGRHRAISAAQIAADEPARRRHAADAAPTTHPDAQLRRRSRTPQRLVAGVSLLAIALAPVLARSASGLGLHDAVAAEVAAHPDQAERTLEELSRGGILAGAVTPAPAPTSVSTDTPGRTQPSSSSSSTGSSTSSSGTAGTAADPGDPGTPTSDSSVGTTAGPAPGTTPAGTTPAGTPSTVPDAVPPVISGQDRDDTTAPSPSPTPDEETAPPSTETPETGPTAGDTSSPVTTGAPPTSEAPSTSEAAATTGSIAGSIVATLTEVPGG